ncbi:hypothetical protein ES705_49997 [subsurface metagenome]
MSSIETKLKKLSHEMQKEVEDFIDFLLEKKNKKSSKKLKLNWAGGLKEYKDKFSSIELQKKVMEWWGD